MQFDLAIYDFNGTLVDDPQIAYSCVTKIFKTHAPSHPTPSFDAWLQSNSNVDFLDFYYQYGIPRTVTIQQLRETWSPHYDKIAEARPLRLTRGAKKVLEFCARHYIPNIVVSASIDDIPKHLKRSRVGHLFCAIHAEVHNKRGKLEEMVKQFGVESSRAFYVDDTYDGLVHAREAGLTAIGFTGGFNCEDRIRQAKPHHVIHSFWELLSILNG